MRVIAGSAKGRTLVAPTGDQTRPATDRIRESLFGILGPDIAGRLVLDLYAGAGTLGIEALSRGAERATFVERSKDALAALRTNIAATGFGPQADVFAMEAHAFLERVAQPFDLVFVDPPFADVAGMEKALADLATGGALAKSAIVVARALKKHRPVTPSAATVFRTKELGEEALLFLRYDAVGGGG